MRGKLKWIKLQLIGMFLLNNDMLYKQFIS